MIRTASDPESFGLAQLEGEGIARRPFWMDSDGMPAACWLHFKADGPYRGSVLLCPPLGYEYSHGHRTVLHLADELAKRGFLAMRLDYPGTGDSAGDESLPDAVARWLDSIRQASRALENLTDAPPSIVGIRLGATLAARASRDVPHLGLVAWAPVVIGRRFVREIKALDRIGAAELEEPDGLFEAGGFPYSTQTLDALKLIDLGLETPQVDSALIVEPDDRHGSSKPLTDRLAELKIPATTIVQTDYADMMAEPQFTIVPSGIVRSITDWLERLHGAAVHEVPASDLDELTSMRTHVVPPTPGGGEETGAVIETLVAIPSAGGGLYGVLAQPLAHEPATRPIVLLPNSGSVHHTGPHRLYVDLARRLATEGFPSLRLDLRNLGDSRLGNHQEENHPYPSTALRDVSEAVGWLTGVRGFRTCTLAGLCSGAHTAFQAGYELSESPISHVVSINPLTFEFKPGISLDTPESIRTFRDARYYGSAIRDPQSWQRLLRGVSDISHILGFVRRRFAMKGADALFGVRQALGLVRTTRLEENLASIASLGRTMGFVFSTSDPGYEILMRNGGRTARRLETEEYVKIYKVENADHTFSRRAARAQAIEAVISEIGRGHPRAG